MILDNKKIKEIQIITDESELLISITDENIIEKDGYKVVCVPASD